MGTPASVRTEQVVATRFPGYVVKVGEYNRRPIAGTSTWSQHSWANADDFHVTSRLIANAEAKERGDEIVAFLRANQAALGIRTILWWVASHYDHIHVDYWPKGTGTPPLTLSGLGSFIYPDGRRVTALPREVPPHGTGLFDEEDMLAARLAVVEAAQKTWLPDQAAVDYWMTRADNLTNPVFAAEWRRDFEAMWAREKQNEYKKLVGHPHGAPTSGAVDPVARQKVAGLEAAVTKIRSALRSV